MKSEMPKSLAAIEKAAESLALASSSLKSDPYSQVMNNLIIRSVNLEYYVGGERPTDRGITRHSSRNNCHAHLL